MSARASADCYGCLGTGKVQGFGSHGEQCPCVAVCWDCDKPFAWGHDDECAPRCCPECREEAAQ